MSGSQDGTEYSQQRRKRVNRLKKMILTTVALLIAVPVAICIVLGVRVAILEHQLRTYEIQTAQTADTQLYGDADQANQNQANQNQVGQNQTGQNHGQGQGTQNRTSQFQSDQDSDILNPDSDSQNTGSDAQGTDGNQNADSDIQNLDDASAHNTDASQSTRKVYLTFDDGPSQYTDAILDILAEYDVKATFFVLGKENETYIPMYQRIVEEGHTLGMHSYSHEYDMIYEDIEAFRTDLHRIQDFLYDITGVISTVYRFPGGSSNSYSKNNIQQYIGYLNDAGIQYVDWNISSKDASYPSLDSEQIVENVLTNIENYDTVVVLMHDAQGKQSTVAALPQIIEAIQAMDDTKLLPITNEMQSVQHRKQTTE